MGDEKTMKTPTKGTAKKISASKPAPETGKKEAGAVVTVKKVKKPVGKTITVRQIGSPIGRPDKQTATLIGLGLNKLHRTRTLEDTPSVRGMVRSIPHLVEIVENAA